MTRIRCAIVCLAATLLATMVAGCGGGSEAANTAAASPTATASPTPPVPPDPDGVKACQWAKRHDTNAFEAPPAEVIEAAGWARGSSSYSIKELAPKLEQAAREVLAAVSEQEKGRAKVRMATPIIELATACLNARYITL